MNEGTVKFETIDGRFANDAFNIWFSKFYKRSV